MYVTMFESGRPRADVGFAVELAAVIDEVATHRVDDPAFGKLLRTERLIVKRIGGDRRRQAKLGKLGGSASFWRRPRLQSDQNPQAARHRARTFGRVRAPRTKPA